MPVPPNSAGSRYSAIETSDAKMASVGQRRRQPRGRFEMAQQIDVQPGDDDEGRTHSSTVLRAIARLTSSTSRSRPGRNIEKTISAQKRNSEKTVVLAASRDRRSVGETDSATIVATVRSRSQRSGGAMAAVVENRLTGKLSRPSVDPPTSIRT